MPSTSADPAAAFSPPRLDPQQADQIVAILRDYCGLSIEPGKRAFLELRLGRRLRALQMPGFGPYLRRLLGPDGAEERQFMAEALATHTTSFFREKAHFDWLFAEGLPNLATLGYGRMSDLRVWSAACSTGPELWTAACVLDRASRGPLGRLRWSVLGTDLSHRALAKAAAATYAAEEIEGLPEDYRRDYLLRSAAPVAGRPLFRVIPDLRRRARFAQLNLAALDRGTTPSAEIIFLRNVMIYFAPSDQARIIRNLATRLSPGGYLLTGHSESLVHPPGDLVAILPSIYRKE